MYRIVTYKDQKPILISRILTFNETILYGARSEILGSAIFDKQKLTGFVFSEVYRSLVDDVYQLCYIAEKTMRDPTAHKCYGGTYTLKQLPILIS